MKNISVDNKILFPNHLNALGEFLVKFSETSLFPVVVRNITSNNDLTKQKILLHNEASAEFWGMNDKGMEGVFVLDLYSRLAPMDRDVHIQRVRQTNQQVLDTHTQTTQVQVILDHQGFVRIYQRVVTPVLGKLNKIIAISALSMEITQYTNLLYLFKLYKQYYRKKTQAIARFSVYLELENYFMDALSGGELSVLLAMVQVKKHKQIAELLNIAPKTVDNYLDVIKYKLKAHATLFDILNNLRDSRQFRLEE